MATSYGTGIYGKGPYGALGGISIVGARASSTHSIIVTLSTEPMHSDGFAAGDALNPTTWTVTRLPGGESLTVVGVAAYSLPREFEIFLLDELGSWLVTHRVQSLTLRSLGGAIITIPNAWDFAGVNESLDPIDASGARQIASRDLANPSFSERIEGVSGTLVIQGGDYKTETGVELEKKLVMRRWTTRRGAFFWLPDYGADLVEQEPIQGGDLLKLRKELERQALLERGVEKATVRLSLERSGILFVRAAITIRGQQVDLGIRVDRSAGIAVMI